MLLFSIGAILLVLLALAFALYPLLKKDTELGLEHGAVLLDIHREKLESLEGKFKQGEIKQADFSQQKKELMLTLLADNHEVGKTYSNSPIDKGLIGAIIIIIPLLAAALYSQWGDLSGYLQWTSLKQTKVVATKILQSPGGAEKVLAKLEKAVEEHPKDAKGWYLLGRLNASLGHAQAAIKAFETANSLRPNDVKILHAYLQALFNQYHQKLPPKGKKIAEKLLRLNKSDPVPLTLLALDAYSRQNYKKAIDYWEVLLPLFSEGSESQKILLDSIAKARKKMKMSGAS